MRIVRLVLAIDTRAIRSDFYYWHNESRKYWLPNILTPDSFLFSTPAQPLTHALELFGASFKLIMYDLPVAFDTGTQNLIRCS